MVCRNVIFLFVVCFTSGCGYSVSEVKKQGNNIIQAIEKYEEDNGTLPNSLNDLTPKYMNTIPTPRWGNKEWKYHNKNGTEYGLNVSKGKHEYPIIFYESSSASWGYDH